MQRLVVIIMVLFLTVGLTQPSGVLQPFNLQERYQHCSVEDHDITPLDFVFEHLLNLESIVNFIEGEHEYTAGDHAHAPFQASGNSIQIALAMPVDIQHSVAPHCSFPASITYSLGKDEGYASRDGSSIFRPPVLG
ncbi:MAG: hypothetical protein EOP51_00270 [Sphingobacteriales bacterium]|nr:MAG: hypothetical protein EOP51_00270 [Sphingobacteriales bacterium]